MDGMEEPRERREFIAAYDKILLEWPKNKLTDAMRRDESRLRETSIIKPRKKKKGKIQAAKKIRKFRKFRKFRKACCGS